MNPTGEVDKLTMVFLEGRINDYTDRAPIDCGVSHTFISEDFIRQYAFRTAGIAHLSFIVAKRLTHLD